MISFLVYFKKNLELNWLAATDANLLSSLAQHFKTSPSSWFSFVHVYPSEIVLWGGHACFVQHDHAFAHSELLHERAVHANVVQNS